MPSRYYKQLLHQKFCSEQDVNRNMHMNFGKLAILIINNNTDRDMYANIHPQLNTHNLAITMY